MEFAVKAPETADHSVVIRLTGVWSEPLVLVDGNILAPTGGVYVLPAAGEGNPAEMRLKTPLLDFVPIVEINGKPVEIAPALASWVYLWCAVPTVLPIALGLGAILSLIGLALSYLSLYQMRISPAPKRFLVSGGINVVAMGVTCALLLLRAAAHRHGVR